MRATIQTLEDRIKPAQAELSSLSATSPEDNEDTQALGAGLGEGGERDAGGKEEKEELGTEQKERERAALAVQRNWREHRKRVGDKPVM